MSILERKYKTVRSLTQALVSNLSAEDQMVQSCPEASSIKWHQARTTWFFETFLLRPYVCNYKTFSEDLRLLLNKYCSPLDGERLETHSPTSFSRPSLKEILDYRAHVDNEMERLLSGALDAEVSRRVLLGLNHEQRAQERLLADIKHAFFTNPLRPAYEQSSLQDQSAESIPQLSWLNVAEGICEIGHLLTANGELEFCFNDETPRHKVYLDSFQIANRKVTCREYAEFMSDDGYSRAEFWLADGWANAKKGGWTAPLYWEEDAADPEGWRVFTLRGSRKLTDLIDTPVCHVSFYEADAFARWRHSRLPTESEWETVASTVRCCGNLLDTRRFHPSKTTGAALEQVFGDCWEWTASSHGSYPGYRPVHGGPNEYDSRFTANEMVLRGGSCVTAADHIRTSFRNHLPPATRWQFTGIRLAH